MSTGQSLVDLVSRVRAGHEEAALTLYQTYAPALSAYVAGQLRHFAGRFFAADTPSPEVDEVTHDTLSTGFEKLGDLREPESFYSWLCQIARSSIQRALRDAQTAMRHRLAFLADRQEPERPPSILDGILDLEDDALRKRRIAAALDALSEERRAVVLLFYYDDQPTDAIAAALGVAQGTVLSRLHRARTELAETLADLR